jgi:hypothetical protein
MKYAIAARQSPAVRLLPIRSEVGIASRSVTSLLASGLGKHDAIGVVLDGAVIGQTRVAVIAVAIIENQPAAAIRTHFLAPVSATSTEMLRSLAS